MTNGRSADTVQRFRSNQRSSSIPRTNIYRQSTSSQGGGGCIIRYGDRREGLVERHGMRLIRKDMRAGRGTQISGTIELLWEESKP